jgi:hypothetical protein
MNARCENIGAAFQAGNIHRLPFPARVHGGGGRITFPAGVGGRRTTLKICVPASSAVSFNLEIFFKS